MARLAINGFGRIGRLTLRALVERASELKQLEVVAINDLAATESLARLFRLDSIHGRFKGVVKASDDSLLIEGKRMRVFCEPDPARLQWRGIDLVLECTGRAKNKDMASKHLKAGAKRVLISAPAEGADKTVVYGVNHQTIKADDKIISNASCTTNCLAPVVNVVEKATDFERGYMTTVHSYTQDQKILDAVHADPYRARAAALSMIPTKTGAAKAVGLVLPHLKGKLDGCAVRVPTANVSMIDLTFSTSRPTDVETINNAFCRAAETLPLKNILKVTDDRLVSADLNHEPASATVDLFGTQVVEGRFCRVMAWYDNEWGFSNRMLDTAAAIINAAK